MARRLAVFGGTFDPPHLGHLVVASEVRFAGGFDEVTLMVSNDPWQKRGTRDITPAPTRLRLVEAAVAGHDGLTAGDLEIRRGGATYSIDTVEALRAAEPGVECSLVLGDDAVAGLDTWQRADELAELVTIVAVGRPGHPRASAGPRWRLRHIDVPAIGISSTLVRDRCAASEPVDFLVTEPVRSLISDLGLYGVRR